MTTYCRHAPGVTFKMSLSFLSMGNRGAFWKHGAHTVNKTD